MKRGGESYDRAAFVLEEVGLEPQAHFLDGADEPIEELREILAEL
ncbi:MAG: hypothetical protein WCC95_20740 [Candidatus Sulfotelmatobacter sp.]|jgi:hypothetical protein